MIDEAAIKDEIGQIKKTLKELESKVDKLEKDVS